MSDERDAPLWERLRARTVTGQVARRGQGRTLRGMSTAERAGSDGFGRGPAGSRPVLRPNAAPGDTDQVTAALSPQVSGSTPVRANDQPMTTVLRSSVKIGQRQITVRRLDPWTVLKLSVVFYAVLLLLLMLLVTLFWAFLNTVGAVETVLGFANEAQLNVRYDASEIARAIFLVGLLGVVSLSGVNVFFCFLYNLVADLTGGFRLTIDDER